jgi:two-component system, NarL family, response regulator LiaR
LNTPFHSRQPASIRILIVDDHAIVREGLRALIEGKPGLSVAGEAANGEEAVRLAAALVPDVILMDLVMPVMDGITAISKIKAVQPEARILVLTSFADDEQVFAAVREGALGYLLKDSSPAELVEAIRSVYHGQPSLTPSVARKLLVGAQELDRPAMVTQEPVAPRPEAQRQAPPDLLTEREIEVLRLVAKGLSNQDIAQVIMVGEGTVRFHVSNILSKLQLENRTQAVLYALRTGLAKLD